MQRFVFWFYVVACFANLVAQVIPSDQLNSYTKPLLMPLLLFYVYQRSIGKTTLKVLLLSAALLFSWFGDIVLMYQATDSYFIAGIVLFLIAQVLYIIILRKTTYLKPKFNFRKIIPFLLYGAVLFYVLLPAGAFTIPIVVYGIVILAMLISAFNRKHYTPYDSYVYAFAGSILFVLSDSVLAINAFKTAIPFAGLFIMSTYCAAQYLLAEGILKHVE